MTRGGKRKNQTGRPPLPAHLKRYKFPTTLTQDEIDLVKEIKASGGYKGTGYVIGEALRLLVEAKCHHKK